MGLPAPSFRPAPLTEVGEDSPMDALARLDEVRRRLAAVDLPLPLPEAAGQQAAARAASSQIDDYVRPRLTDLEALRATLAGVGTAIDEERQGQRITTQGNVDDVDVTDGDEAAGLLTRQVGHGDVAAFGVKDRIGGAFKPIFSKKNDFSLVKKL